MPAEERVSQFKRRIAMEIKLDKNKKVKVGNPEDVYPIMKEILLRENRIGRAQEHFWMVGLNQTNKILYIELVSLGASNMAAIQPREAFRLAIHKLAIRVILVHNHPSGDVEPSEMDQDLTDHFIQAGRFLNVQVIDHLIINEKTHYSFVNSGLFAELQESKKYVLPYELEERAKNEGIDIGIKEGKIEMAKAMKVDGVSVELIEKYTHLSREEIERL
jgi:DNA repair protein RadC